MQQIIRELEQVRRWGRLLLVAQRVLQWAAVLIATALVCGVLDYLLRLPGWIRLGLGLLIVLWAGFWLVTRLARAGRFRPDLSILALRAERLYPSLAGQLASSVEFASHPDAFSHPQQTASLAHASVRSAQDRTRNVPAGRMLKPTRTVAHAAVALALGLGLSGVVLAAPGPSLLAARRWLNPLGDAQWPRRTRIVGLVSQDIWPADTPLRLEARVVRGYRPSMRSWAVYRFVTTDTGPGSRDTSTGPWISVLMSEQSLGAPDRPAPAPPIEDTSDALLESSPASLAGQFERIVDLEGAVPDSSPTSQTSVQVYFEAGDDRTQSQRIRLVPRPAVKQARVSIEPPAYAQGLVGPREILFHEQTGQIVSTTALLGSTVRFQFDLNKPVANDPGGLSDLVPGFASIPGATSAADAGTIDPPKPPSIRITFDLDQTRQSPLVLRDAHGLTNQSDREYRIEAQEDNPPAVSLLEPATDQTVLATAVVDVEAMAMDDVAVESVAIHATPAPGSAPGSAPENAAPNDSPSDSPGSSEELARRTGRAQRLTEGLTLELSRWALGPGDRVVLTAVAQDVFDLHEKRHEPAVSAPRVLRVIDAATFIGQIRAELEGLRQQALRLVERQEQVLPQPAAEARPEQRQVSQSIEAQGELLERLTERTAQNRLDDPSLSKLLQGAADLVDRAHGASRKAEQDLEAAQDPGAQDPQARRDDAREQQQDTLGNLSQLVSLLDQGRDALALELLLRQIATEQEHLLAQTRTAMPRTIGQSPEDLDPGDRQRLEDLGARQENLSEQAQKLLEQMLATSAAILSRREDDPNQTAAQDQAAAEALGEAAAIGQRQGLSQKMKEASGNVNKNRLAQGGQQQEQSLSIVKDMLTKLQEQDQKRREILRRRLARLKEAIEQLIAQQTRQIELLDHAAELPPLEPGMSRLRRNTQSVEELAKATPQTESPAGLLSKASQRQADAVTALRASQREPAGAGEQEAREHLVKALEELEEARRRAESEQARKDRADLRHLYEQLAQQEGDLIDHTKEAGADPQPDREQKLQIIRLGHLQEDLRSEANHLRAKVQEKVVFQHLHDQVDLMAKRASQRLGEAKADDQAVESQKAVAELLTSMADALRDDPDEDPFAGSEGGGGSGSGGGTTPLVPPVAELKLLRAAQDMINHTTRRFVETPGADASTQRRALLRLGAEQRALAGIAERLIQQMAQAADGHVEPGAESKPEETEGPE